MPLSAIVLRHSPAPKHNRPRDDPWIPPTQAPGGSIRERNIKAAESSPPGWVVPTPRCNPSGVHTSSDLGVRLHRPPPPPAPPIPLSVTGTNGTVGADGGLSELDSEGGSLRDSESCTPGAHPSIEDAGAGVDRRAPYNPFCPPGKGGRATPPQNKYQENRVCAGDWSSLLETTRPCPGSGWSGAIEPSPGAAPKWSRSVVAGASVRRLRVPAGQSPAPASEP